MKKGFWEVTVENYYGERTVYPYYGCTETQARKKAMLRRHSKCVVSVRELDQSEYVNIHGLRHVGTGY